jgi:dUTP pyrophosphatase
MDRLRLISIPTFLNTVDGENAELPARQTTEAYGYDVRAYLPNGNIALTPLTPYRVPTGLRVALPPHTCLFVCSRSGLAAKGVQVINAPGIIDSDYRDEVQVLLTYIAPPTSAPFVVEHGMRIAQLVFMSSAGVLDFTSVSHAEWEKELASRQLSRSGGFGSTGV